MSKYFFLVLFLGLMVPISYADTLFVSQEYNSPGRCDVEGDDECDGSPRRVDGGLKVQRLEKGHALPLFFIGAWEGMPEDWKRSDIGYMVHPKDHHVFLREPVAFGKKETPIKGRTHVAWIIADHGPLLRHATWNTPDIYEKEEWRGNPKRPDYGFRGFVCEETEGLRLYLLAYDKWDEKQIKNHIFLPPQNWMFNNGSGTATQSETKELQRPPVPGLNYGDVYGWGHAVYFTPNIKTRSVGLPENWQENMRFPHWTGLVANDNVKLDEKITPDVWSARAGANDVNGHLYGKPNGFSILVMTSCWTNRKTKNDEGEIKVIGEDRLRFDGKKWHPFDLPDLAKKKIDFHDCTQQPRTSAAQRIMGCRIDDACAVIGPYFIVVGDGQDGKYWWLHIPTGESGFAPIPKDITHSIGFYETKGRKPGDGDHWYQVGGEVWAQPLRGGSPRKMADKVEGDVVGVYETDQDLSKLTYDELVKDIPQEYRNRITWKKPATEKGK